jgi:tetratricopeptide (TPR) repeat protein
MNLKPLILIILAFFLCSNLGYSQGRRSKNKEKELTEKERLQEADLFGKGLVERSKGNVEGALAFFDEALEIDPNDAASWYEKGRLYLKMDRKDEALEAAGKAKELDTENKWYLVLYANVCKANEKYDEYVKTYEILVEQYPTDLDFLQELAFAYYFTGDYKNAIVAYDKIEDEVGVNEGLTIQKVGFYEKLKQPKKGVAEFQKLIESNPQDPRYYALMAEYCAKNGLDDQAIAAYEKIVELNPSDPYVHISLADYYNKKGNTERSFEELKLGLANTQLDLKTKINLLVNYYQGNLTDQQKKHALELSEVLMDAHPDEILSHTFYATMLYENGEYTKARPLFKEILESESSNYAIWEQLLFCDLNLQDFQLLAKDSEEAVDLFPSYPLPYFFSGLANLQLKDYVKAEAYLKSGKDFIVNNNALLEQFYSTLGDTYHAMDDFTAAYSSYDKVLTLNPKNSVVLNNYAYYLSLEGKQLVKAATMAKQSVELDPYNSNNLDTYAWVLYQQGKYEEALIWIEKAYNNNGSSSGVVLEHYGDILYKLGRKDKALEFWIQAGGKTDASEALHKKIKDKKINEE